MKLRIEKTKNIGLSRDKKEKRKVRSRKNRNCFF